MQFHNSLAYQTPVFSLTEITRSWRPKLGFSLKQGRYVIKTAETRDEFEATIRLRSDVFLKEFVGVDLVDDANLDFDAIDREADFLIIKDCDTDEVLASYRLICSTYSDDFYSRGEFALGDFLKTPGPKLELSRACIRADKRSSGIFLHLLWKGLSHYIKMSEATHLFGCSSVPYLNLSELVSLYQSLQDIQALSERYGIEPHPDFRIVDVNGILRFNARPGRHPKVALPPLLGGYIKAGARVHGAPAYDQDFKCLDLFTILDLTSEPSDFLKRYMDRE